MLPGLLQFGVSPCSLVLRHQICSLIRWVIIKSFAHLNDEISFFSTLSYLQYGDWLDTIRTWLSSLCSSLDTHLFTHMLSCATQNFSQGWASCMTDVSQNCERTGEACHLLTSFPPWFTHSEHVCSDTGVHRHDLLLVT